MLKIRNLKKTYKTGDEALKSVDIDIPTSQVMALIGPSGAGKSTLIRCINRLVEPKREDYLDYLRALNPTLIHF